jgi:hypothetical protein
MNKSEFSKDFKYTIRSKKGRVMAQSIISFGTQEIPFPKDWQNDSMAQMCLYEYKEKFLNLVFDVSIEEGDELDDFGFSEDTFSDDWKNEMNKFKKDKLIDFLRDKLIELQKLKNK